MYDFGLIRQREQEKYGLSFPAGVDKLRESFFQNGQSDGSDPFYKALGGAVCGPVFTCFCEWAVQVAQKENVKQIFPLMREGQLYSKLLEAIISLRGLDIRVTPLYVSRTSSYYALCYGEFDREFFDELTFHSGGPIGNCFHKLGLDDAGDIYEKDEEKINTFIKNKNYAALDGIYQAILERGLDKQINQRIASTKTLLREYLLQNGASESFVTLDFGSMGTIPQAIDNCSSKDIKKIHLFLGACLPVERRRARGHDIRFLLNNYRNTSELIDMFFMNFTNQLFETITMGNTATGTATGYQKGADGKVRVICDTVMYSESLRKAVDGIQDGILDFCVQYVKQELTSKPAYSMQQMLTCSVASFCRLVDAPFIEEVKKLGWFEYDDSVRKTTLKFIVQQNENGSFIPKPLPEADIYIREREVSKWAQGSMLLHSNRTEWNVSSSERRKVAVYGCGRWGKVLIEKLQDYAVDIVCIVDKKQAGSVYLTYPVIGIERLNEYDFEDVVIASVDFAEEIAETLEAFALQYSRKFITHNIVI